MSAILHNAIDTHVHSSPDVIARKLDDLELVAQARTAGIRALVLKCHYGSTCERAWLLNRIQSEVRVFGGLVLNDHVGGFNPRAVECALQMGATQIWMPTKSAANHQAHLGGGNGYTVFNGAKLRDDVIAILKLIAEADVILATGHLSPEESRALIEEALAKGVRRISVTHPEWGVTAMPIKMQQQFATSGAVFFERCLVSTEQDAPKRVEFKDLVGQIRAVGVSTTIAATDYGLPQYPAPAVGLRTFAERLIGAGFSEAEVRRMIAENPARLLRLDGGAT